MLRKLAGGIVDAVIGKRNGVQLRRKAEIAARFRQNFAADKTVIGRKLLLQLGERILIAVQLVLFEQQADSSDIGVRVFEILFHFGLGWPHQPGSIQLFAKALFGLHGQRLEARL